jgi:hypothetical protein
MVNSTMEIAIGIVKLVFVFEVVDERYVVCFLTSGNIFEFKHIRTGLNTIHSKFGLGNLIGRKKERFHTVRISSAR